MDTRRASSPLRDGTFKRSNSSLGAGAAAAEVFPDGIASSGVFVRIIGADAAAAAAESIFQARPRSHRGCKPTVGLLREIFGRSKEIFVYRATSAKMWLKMN